MQHSGQPQDQPWSDPQPCPTPPVNPFHRIAEGIRQLTDEDLAPNDSTADDDTDGNS